MIPIAEPCLHPTLISDADSQRYYHCADCGRTLRVVVIIGPLGNEPAKLILIGEEEIT